jgi:hypothetical protein
MSEFIEQQHIHELQFHETISLSLLHQILQVSLDSRANGNHINELSRPHVTPYTMICKLQIGKERVNAAIWLKGNLLKVRAEN